MRRFALPVLLLLVLAVSPSAAQTAVPSMSTSSVAPNDSVFRRARRMVSEGNGAAGRALVDSLLQRAEEGTSSFGDALFWRGALAETAADAERDYRRVIVEYPLSNYADDALLAIVELEQARGDRAGALAHLQRFVREHPVSPARGVAALAAARLAFDQRDTKTGCAMITDARASAPSADVELRNQIDYFGSRCANVAMASTAAPQPVAATAAPQRDSGRGDIPPKKTLNDGAPKAATKSTTHAATAPSAKAISAPVASTPTPPARAPVADGPARKASTTAATATVTKTKGSYTIQLAAYTTRADAEQLVHKLGAKGVVARVSGTTKPFRVRLDFYPTRQAAQEEVAALKQRGIIGFVTTEDRAPDRQSP